VWTPKKAPRWSDPGCLMIVLSGMGLFYVFGLSMLSGDEFPEGSKRWLSAVLARMSWPNVDEK